MPIRYTAASASQAENNLPLPAARSSELFPLPFTPFEYYYLLEDRPGFPSVFPIRLHAQGPLDRDAFTWAYRVAHERHPLLSAQIAANQRSWPTWTAAAPPTICWECTAQGVIGTSEAPGVQMRLEQRGDLIDWTLTFHHCAVDGMGAFMFVGDLFIAYAHACSGASGMPPWRKVDPARLRNRDGHQLFSRWPTWRDLWRIARVNLPVNIQRAAIVSEETSLTAPPVPAERVADYLVYHLSEEETAELSRIAGSLSVMLHDLLLRDYFLVLAAWNRGTPEARYPLRMLVPVNMRRREDYRMPAANVFSFAFITRRISKCGDRAELLRSIRDDMSRIKQQKLGLYFEASLRLISHWPAFLRWSLLRKWTFATAVFTNLGTGLDNVPLPECEGRRICGNLVFDEGSGAGPIRPDTRVSFAVHTYAGRMAVCLRVDPLKIRTAQRHTFLDAFVAALRETIATGT